ncbi:MAG: Eco57I restriction-modification methylase domain-containing protein, partial [Vampirovibrionales bacterium]|nr:Eco57I restriction-modification methylase domain-containing protein [Vampirovibrionales bacterium]
MKLKREEAIRLVNNALTQAYDEASFRQLVQNLCPQAEMLNEPVKTLIPDSFQGSVTAYKRLAKYEDPESYTLDVLAVKLSSQRTLENARTLQRNFVARYLNGSRGGQLKDAALVAFYADDGEDWRFSLVRMDYELDAEKQKVEKTLTPARRFSFLVGKGEKTHTARQQLLPILETPTAITLKEIEAAFNIEKVTKEFFEEYKKLYLRLKEALDKHLEKDATTKGEFTGKGIKTEDFAKRLLGQLVFLYFLQKKGWLGVAKGAAWGTGSKNYLKELFDTENVKPNRNFFNDVLEHLFYDALATERQTQDHFFPALNCKIPFLNGGLFEPFKGYAWDATDILLDNAIFKAIFDVFDLYNFTVREDEPLDKEVAVDPEMLGNVFERLMSEEERGKSGAFYTPKPVVHYMSQQSLINYLDMAINTVERPINDTQPKQTALFELPKAKQASLTMRVYEERIPRSDLAVLVQAGESAIEHERRIAEKGSETDAYQHKMPFSIRQHKQALDDLLKQVRVLDPAIGSGAFPVGMMIEIVRTRRLLAAMMKRDVNAYDLKWDCIEHSLYGVDKNASAVDIAKLRLWLSLVVDEESFDDIKPLPNLDYKIREGDSLIGFTVNTSQSHQALTKKLLPLKHQFFAETRPARKKALRAEIDSLLAEKYEASRRIEGAAITFDPHLEFSEVFSPSDTWPNSGFDVVIANPPYVRQEAIKDLKAGLSVRYKNVAKGTADLLVYFYELAHKLLREEGCLTFISSNKFMRAGYGDK